MNQKNKIYYWSPHFVNIATRKAVINSAYSVKKYSKNFDCSIINFFGEFTFYKDEILKKKVGLINYFNPNIINYLPKYGKIKSRFSYLIIFIFSFLPLKKLLDKDKPDYFIIHLITSLPLILLIIFKFKTKFILRISGLPKMNFLRKFLWKVALKKIFVITCPTKITCDYIKGLKIVDDDKVKLLYDPIIDVKEITNKIKNKNIIVSENSNYFFSAGRLTKQKNFLFLCKSFSKFLETNPNYKLLIAGEGEERKNLTNFIKKNSLEEKIILLGHIDNIFPVLKKSSLFILPSLWEDPGFVLIEAAFCKVLTISSNCPNGPIEIIKHNHNGILFQSNNLESFLLELNKLLLLKQKRTIVLNNLKECKKFSIFNHHLQIKKILMGM